MAKGKTVFVCQECGSESPRWAGRCSVCGAWNSMIEEKVPEFKEDDKRRRTGSRAGGHAAGKPEKLKSVTAQTFTRMKTGIDELDRVLGGGIVRGSLTLISGEPGIGKSTIIIQAAAEIAAKEGPVLYVSGEESEEQIKMRADRVCGDMSDDLFVLSETNMENISAITEQTDFKFIVIDSIQTMYSDELDSAPGSVSQVRTCGNELMRIGKGKNIPIFIVAHVTKSGELAGPKIVEHLVDCVLQFNGERSQDLRILRAAKNRFGTTSEIGAFEMTEKGLESIQNLSRSFLDGMEENIEGSVAAAVYEGTRPLLIEIQALTASTNVGFARRTSLGVDARRLNMIIAVLERKAGLDLLNKDVYVMGVGGLRPEGTSTDLAAAIAIHSATLGRPVKGRTLAIGEIGLTGELRPVQNADRMVNEAARMGFDRVILPASGKDKIKKAPDGIQLIRAKSIREALKAY